MGHFVSLLLISYITRILNKHALIESTIRVYRTAIEVTN
jgi:hypothetical protein